MDNVKQIEFIFYNSRTKREKDKVIWHKHEKSNKKISITENL